MRAELIHKWNPHNAWLQFYGAYVSADMAKAIVLAGWVPQEFLWRPSDRSVDEHTPTDVFCQPPGSDLFNGSTPEEGKRNLAALRAALKPFGIKLGRPRRQTFAEAI